MKEEIKEIWKSIKYPIDFSKLYKVSNLGRVKRIKTVSVFKSDGSKRILKEKILKPIYCTSRNVEVVILCNNKKRYNISVHRLVYCNFILNIEKNKNIFHIDGNNKNNNVSNLTLNSKVQILNKYDKETINKVIELIKQKNNKCKIEKTLNISTEHIDIILYYNNIKYEPHPNCISKNIKLINKVKRFTDRYRTKQIKIAEKFNVSTNTVRKILHNNDIQYYYDYK